MKFTYLRYHSISISTHLRFVRYYFTEKKKIWTKKINSFKSVHVIILISFRWKINSSLLAENDDKKGLKNNNMHDNHVGTDCWFVCFVVEKYTNNGPTKNNFKMTHSTLQTTHRKVEKKTLAAKTIATHSWTKQKKKRKNWTTTTNTKKKERKSIWCNFRLCFVYTLLFFPLKHLQPRSFGSFVFFPFAFWIWENECIRLRHIW